MLIYSWENGCCGDCDDGGGAKQFPVDVRKFGPYGVCCEDWLYGDEDCYCQCRKRTKEDLVDLCWPFEFGLQFRIECLLLRHLITSNIQILGSKKSHLQENFLAPASGFKFMPSSGRYKQTTFCFACHRHDSVNFQPVFRRLKPWIWHKILIQNMGKNFVYSHLESGHVEKKTPYFA